MTDSISFQQSVKSPEPETMHDSIFSKILHGLKLGIIVLDTKNRSVFFHNPWTGEILKDRVDLEDYDALCELFLHGNGGQSGFPLRAGALHDDGLGATYLSAGLGYAALGWGIDIAGRREVKGGDENLIIASMRFFGPRMPAPGVE